MLMSRKNYFGLLLFGALSTMGLTLVPNNASAAASWFNCKPTSVFEMISTGTTTTPQFQVACSNNISTGVNWVGIRASDYNEQQKGRFVSLASAAILSGKTFRVYVTDTVCPDHSNCRLVTSWSVY